MKEWIVCEDNCLKCSYGATLDCDGDCPRCPRNTYCPCVTFVSFAAGKLAPVAQPVALSGEDPGLEGEVATELAELSAEVAHASLEAQLSGPYDERNAVVAVSAGVGGTDAADWAEMLVRMYLRWAERRGFRGELLDMTPRDEAGLPSAALSVEGGYADGYPKTGRGAHRPPRTSPPRFSKSRQTSF